MLPSSYTALMPAQNNLLSGFLTWTKSYIASILVDSNNIAALAGIDWKNYESVAIISSLPIKSPAGNLIAITGNMSDKKVNLLSSFIKISENCIGSFFALQNHSKFLWQSSPRSLSLLNYFVRQLGILRKKKSHLPPSPTWSQSHLAQQSLMKSSPVSNSLKLF
jgi:hypothetical protein